MVNRNKIIVAAQSFGRAEPEGARILEAAGFELVYLPGLRSGHDELSELMRDVDTVAVVAGGEPITGEMIQASPSLRVIGMHGVGLNQIDCETAEKRGIIVRAVPGGNAPAVADLTWGLMIAVARNLTAADAAVQRGDWTGKFIGVSLNDKILGIIGFGAIGQLVARRATGFNMTILAYDIFRNEAAAEALGTRYVDLETLLEESDYITIHLPLTKQTVGLIGEREFGLMKRTAYLINVSRGGVVDEMALCQVLEAGKIAGAGVDVYSKEPFPVDHPLLQAPNCVFTPHIGARTRETIRFIGIETAKNILRVLCP